MSQVLGFLESSHGRLSLCSPYHEPETTATAGADFICSGRQVALWLELTPEQPAFLFPADRPDPSSTVSLSLAQ